MNWKREGSLSSFPNRVSEPMRSIAQPGPPVPERIQWVEARGRAFSFPLQAGLPLL